MNANKNKSRINDNAAIQFLTMDMLENIMGRADNPKLLSEYLTHQMRGLLGGKTVALLECSHSSKTGGHRIVNVCPDRHKENIDKPELERLAVMSHDLSCAVLWTLKKGPDEARLILKDTGWGSTIVLPLTFGSSRFGVLFVFGLMDLHNVEILLETLETLTRIIALVLKNSLQYENLEKTIQQRTRELTKKERKFRSLAEVSPVGIFRTDKNGGCLYVNRLWTEMTGLSFVDSMGRGWILAIHEEDRDSVVPLWEKSIRGTARFKHEFRFKGPEGSVIWALVQAAPEIDESGQLTGYVGTVTDITGRVESEERIKESLLEKEVLIQELYHRTKNNMQVISSFLQLQLLFREDEIFVPVFNDVISRIETMSLVHQKLYQSKNLSRINIREYIEELVPLIMSYHNSSSCNIKPVLEIEDKDFLIDIATPLGLVINELLSNTFKHAFPDSKNGEVMISLRSNESGSIVVIISDNGMGLPEGFTIESCKSLGLATVVNIIEKQLSGDIEFVNSDGLTVLISFEDNIYDERI